MNNMIDIQEYCDKCKRQIVRPFDKQCYRKCKYSNPKESYNEGFRQIKLKYRGRWQVYFIKCDKYVKIGQTFDIDKRLDGINRDNPFEIDLLLLIQEAPDRLERALHKYFEPYRYKREWFLYSKELQSFLYSSEDNIKATLNKIIFDVDCFDIEQIKDIED
jgi:hypothetical protein